jgi:oligopeptide transport system substrate-binding protein
MRRTRMSLLLALVATAVALVAVGASSAKPAAGSSVSIAETEPDHLTPQRSTAVFDQAQALFEPLMRVDAKGKLQQDMATSLKSSQGGKVWTITIHKGWKWQNGEPVTAQNYVNAWNATAYGPNAWATNGELTNIQGYTALNPKSGKPKTKKLSGLKVLSPTSFRVTLAKPDSQFPLELTAGQMGFLPLPNAAFKNLAAYDLAPIGDGMYQMDGKWKHNVDIKVKAWPGYEGVKPHVQAIDFKIYADVHTAYNDVRAGNLDITFLEADQYQQAAKDFKGRVVSYNAPAIDYMGFPLYDQRFKDIRVREALSMAIDRKAISKALFGNVLQPASGWVPSTVVGARVGLCGQFCTYNPTKAKALLQAAGGWSGTMNIWYPAGQGFEALYQAIGNEFRQNLGIQVAYPSPAGFNPFFDDLTASKVDGPFRGHWGALYPSAQNTLHALYTPTGDGHFEVFYDNAAVTNLIAKGDAATSVAGSVKAYQQAEDQIKKDFPTAPLFYAKYVYVHSNHVKGVVIDANQVELRDLQVAG